MTLTSLTHHVRFPGDSPTSDLLDPGPPAFGLVEEGGRIAFTTKEDFGDRGDQAIEMTSSVRVPLGVRI